MSDNQYVEYTTEGALAFIHINRPDSLNAFNREVYRGLNESFVRFNEDKNLRAAVYSRPIFLRWRRFEGLEIGDG